jgi:hypothetical protein
VNHTVHYTVAQANAALRHVGEVLDRLRRAREGLNDEEVRSLLDEAAPQNGGGEAGRRVSESFLALRSGLLELQTLEIVLRDLDRGLIDFPSIRDGREVYLCWEEGEERIEFWHDVEAGFAGRQPL